MKSNFVNFCLDVQMATIYKKALLSQRWPRDAPYIYL